MLSRGMNLIAVFALALAATAAVADGPPESPQQLIKDVVFNELIDHQHHGYFEYLDVKRTGEQTVLKAEVETSAGRIQRTLIQDGQPLTVGQQEEEARRLEALLRDPSQQQKLLRDYRGDEDRIARIVSLMPEGFLYQFDGMEGGEIRLKYRPNPDFKPPTYEARVFHGMAGTVWIDGREKRLTRLEGQLISNVDFGYGLLGRLDKGGTFYLERVEVAPGNWKTRALDVHVAGHVILLKSIGKDQTERRSEFREVPANLTLEQAEVMLTRAMPADLRMARLDAGNVARPNEKPSDLPVAMAFK